MKWQLERFTKDYFITFIRRILYHTNQWTNEGIEFINLPKARQVIVLDEFNPEDERYPAVLVESVGGNMVNLDLRNFIGAVSVQQLYGKTADGFKLLGGTDGTRWAVKIQAHKTYELQSIGLLFEHPSGSLGYDNTLFVNLFSGSGVEPLNQDMVSSGTIDGAHINLEKGAVYRFAELDPYYTLQSGSQYWIEFMPEDSGVSFFAHVDSDFAGIGSTISSRPTGSATWTSDTGSLMVALNGPISRRYGGGAEYTINITPQAKDKQTAEVLAELLAQYINLSKAASFDRNATNTSQMSEEMGLSMLSRKGITIRNIRLGGIQTRLRGNDQIFSKPIMIDVYSQWYEDFEGDLLKDIEVTINHYR